uniref:PiRNA biogenesis protein EXD1 isoform X4 n=1 Tax=Pogona vitticeps TaxID=103695 RepID=A0A6J0TQH6_9SAUR
MDPSSDYHFLHDILGKTVKVTLKCGTFQGVLQHVDSTQTIFLKRVRNLENGKHVPGIKMFFGHEIINVELLEDLLQRGAEEKPTLSTYREVPAAKFSAEDKEELIKQGAQHPGTVSQEKQQPLLGYVTYNFAGEEKAEDIEFVVIDQFQKKFGYAMMHIKKQTVCGIAAEGVGLCRHGKLSWLQVATRSQIFLFDIFLLGARAFKNGLQMILEDRNVLKVIHDCRWLSDCLSHQYGILLSNVFDTQVADVLQFSKETGGFLPHCISTLQECLMRYLKMPYKNVSFMEQRQSEIEISCMKLPQELRQLADIHKARRENAVQKFQLNEEGLLIRKDMEHLKSKWVQEERNKTGGRDLILSSYTTSPKLYNVSCVHNRNLAGQNNSVKEQKVCKYGSTSGDADGDGRTESEVKTITVSCKSISRA